MKNYSKQNYIFFKKYLFGLSLSGSLKSNWHSKKRFFFLFIILSCLEVLGQQYDVPSLHHNANFHIGTSVRFVPFSKDTLSQKIQQHHFNSYTAGSDMKMYQISPRSGVYHWSRVDSIVEYTVRNNQRLFGHNLIWHSSTPKWVEKKALKNPEWLDFFLKEYITKYVGRYKGIVDGWDVVNEALNTKGEGFRSESIWFETLGREYIEKAFKYAHAADPDAILFYNDFNIERDSLKLNSMIEMINDFLDRDVPISGIGFQMHIRIDTPNEIIARSLKKAADTGLKIHLSEVDIIFNTHDDTKGGGIQLYDKLTEEMKLAQAQKYADLVNMYKDIVPKEQQYGITFWGFNDRDTWIRRFFKMIDWPTIYDDNLLPKPAFYGFLNALKKDSD